MVQRFVLFPRQILWFYAYAQDFHLGGLCKSSEPQVSEDLIRVIDTKQATGGVNTEIK